MANLHILLKQDVEEMIMLKDVKVVMLVVVIVHVIQIKGQVKEGVQQTNIVIGIQEVQENVCQN